MTEPEVIRRVHAFLKQAKLLGYGIGSVYTDSHPTLVNYNDLAPFQRFTLDLGDLVLHPDLVARLDDGESIIAVEAKGTDGLVKGIGQASLYRVGFHYSFLAAAATHLGGSLIDAARRHNVGVIAAGDNTSIVHAPAPALPERAAQRFVQSQLDVAANFGGSSTFSFNLPTHYLVWAIAMELGRTYSYADLPEVLGSYPIPQNGGWRAALAGASRLGLLSRMGASAALTDLGGAVKVILPHSLAEWTSVHQQIKAGAILAECQPISGAVLRMLILRDPVAHLIIGALRAIGGRANFAQLAIAADKIDHARAPVLFLKSEALATLADSRGRVRWNDVEGQDYRSQVFFQYKSILKHAGLLAPGPLGSPSATGYDPQTDLWRLRQSPKNDLDL